MALIPKPQFPNVPQLPGVPQVLRSSSFPAAPLPILSLGLAIGNLWQSIFSTPLWAIYKHQEDSTNTVDDTTSTGADLPTQTVQAKRVPVVVPDSFGEFSYRNEWSITDAPLQDGEFASFNKVANPFEISVRMYKGGSKEARKKFLDSIDTIVGTLDLYDIVTPEKTYLNVNVLRNELARRGPRGAFFLSECDLYFREIREVSAQYTTTSITTQDAKNPSAVTVINTGVVQPQPLASVPGDVGL